MEEPKARREIEWGPLVGGIILGWIASWGVFAVTGLMLYSSLGDAGFAESAWPNVVGLAMLFLVPVVFGWRLLRQRRRAGQMVSGALLGLTIGAIVGAGVCLPAVVAG